MILVLLFAVSFAMFEHKELYDRLEVTPQPGIPGFVGQKLSGSIYGIPASNFVTDPRTYQPYNLKDL